MSAPQRVQQILSDLGLSANGLGQVKEMPSSTRSAADAASTLGCTVAEIAKSIIFKAENGDAVLVIASGVNRISEKKISALMGQKLSKADADFVRDKTGYAIGGVPPVGHGDGVRVFLDQDLQQFNRIWAAAGSPVAVFQTEPKALAQALQLSFCEVKE